MVNRMESKINAGVKQKRPYLHPDVFDKVRNCEKCGGNERMIFWRNVKMKPEYQFEFLVCRVCGYTVIFERYIRETATGIDVNRPDLIGVLHDVTSGSRAAATRFATHDAMVKAISIQNISYISLEGESKIIFAAEERRRLELEERERKVRAANDNRRIVESCNSVRANGINFQLKVTRAMQEEKRKEKMKPANFECKYCSKKFVTSAKLNNHRCNSDDKETYIERAKRLNDIRSARKNGNGAIPQ